MTSRPAVAASGGDVGHKGLGHGVTILLAGAHMIEVLPGQDAIPGPDCFECGIVAVDVVMPGRQYKACPVPREQR